MRTAFNSKILTNEKEELIGIYTGADFVSEHEWGIGPLREALGMKDDAVGVEKRTVQKYDNIYLDVVHSAAGSFAYLIMGRTVARMFEGEKYWNKKRQNAEEKWEKHCKHSEELLYCEWSEDSLMVLVKGARNVKLLEVLYMAAKQKDLLVGLERLGSTKMENSGILIIPVSLMDKKDKDIIEERDLNSIRLKKADEKIGIKEKLKKAGREFFACSPRFIQEENKGIRGTKYDVIYWLNPYHQDVDNFGWFTVEELEQWIEGKGPVPMANNLKK